MQLLFRKFPLLLFGKDLSDPGSHYQSQPFFFFTKSYAAGELFYDSFRTGEFFKLVLKKKKYVFLIIIIIPTALYDL